MERCKTCKWWGTLEDRDDVYTYEGAIPATYRLCLITHREHWLDEPPEDARMMVAGYEFDGLATAPDFGCVQHEPREDNAE